MRVAGPFLLCLGSALNGASPQLHHPLPLRFEQNPGPGPASFTAHVGPLLMQVFPDGNNLLIPSKTTPQAIRTKLLGANPRATVHGEDQIVLATNYLTGNDPKAWRTNIANFSRVRTESIYPAIDLIFYGSASDLEYDFTLRPGADPARIRFSMTGYQDIAIDPSGDLVLKAGGESIRWHKPIAYQEIAGHRTPVDAAFDLQPDRSVKFRLGTYDSAQPLTIDPTLTYASYFGGTGNEVAYGIATDPSGNYYITGVTSSANLPLAGAGFQTSYGGNTTQFITGDVYVAKFTNAGVPVYVTFLGGGGDDVGIQIAVDSSGSAYVTGYTNSQNFPVSPTALQTSFHGALGNQLIRFGDAFVTKLSPSGSQIMYSTFLGGTSDDVGLGIAVDSTGNAYVTGTTLSGNFPVTAGSFQTKYGGSSGQPNLLEFPYPFFVSGDGFVAKVNPTGSALIYATFLGGSSDDTPQTIAVDAAGNAFVGGATLSRNFPVTAGAFQPTWKGLDNNNEFFNFGDGFVSKLNPAGSALVYSTFLGGSGDDSVTSIALDAAGNVYAAGVTSSRDFPATPGSFQITYGGPTATGFSERIIGDAFVAKLNPSGSGLVYATYAGRSGNEGAFSIAVDAQGRAYVGGFTSSASFPTTQDAFQRTYAGFGSQFNNGDDFGDAFVMVLDPNGETQLYSTFLGGSRDDMIHGIALDPAGNILVAGSTVSTDFPTTSGARQKTFGGTGTAGRLYGDAFVAQLTGLSAGGPSLTAIGNPATNTFGKVAPGMVFIAYGTSIGPAALALGSLDATGQILQSTQSGTQFLFNGIPAPIYYVSNGQSAGLVPYGIGTQGTVQVVAVYNGQRSAAFPVQAVPALPGVLSANSSGSGQGSILNQDSSINSAQNPAAAGSVVVLFGTGEGITVPAGVDGKLATSVYPVPLLQPVTVTVGGQPATVLYAGAAPRLVAGVLQINIQLPAGVGAGNQPVVVTIGGITSTQTGLTVAIR